MGRPGYQQVSVPHEEWAAALMGRLPLGGGETVLDAGARGGRPDRGSMGRQGQHDEFRRVSGEVVAGEPYAAHLDAAGFEEPWFYADAEETEERMRAVHAPLRAPEPLGRRLAVSMGRKLQNGLSFRPANG